MKTAFPWRLKETFAPIVVARPQLPAHTMHYRPGIGCFIPNTLIKKRGAFAENSGAFSVWGVWKKKKKRKKQIDWFWINWLNKIDC